MTTLGALYLASLSAFVAQAGYSPDADRDENIMLALVSGTMLLAGAGLLLIARASA